MVFEWYYVFVLDLYAPLSTFPGTLPHNMVVLGAGVKRHYLLNLFEGLLNRLPPSEAPNLNRDIVLGKEKDVIWYKSLVV